MVCRPFCLNMPISRYCLCLSLNLKYEYINGDSDRKRRHCIKKPVGNKIHSFSYRMDRLPESRLAVFRSHKTEHKYSGRYHNKRNKHYICRLHYLFLYPVIIVIRKQNTVAHAKNLCKRIRTTSPS